MHEANQSKIVVEENNGLQIKIVNKNTTSWWDDILITENNIVFKVVGCSLDVKANYKLTQMLQSYYSFVTYYNNLVITINNKPLSLAHLNVLDINDTLEVMENVEKAVLSFKQKVKMLEAEIVCDINTFISTGKIVIEKKSFTSSFGKTFKSIFKWKKHDDSHANAVQVSVQNNLMGYNS